MDKVRILDVVNLMILPCYTKKLQYIEAYCPGGSQFLRNCTLLQWLPVQGFILKILSRDEGIVTQRG